MIQLLEDAIDRLRELPAEMQETAARTIIRTLEEDPEPEDREAIDEARRDFAKGDYVTFDQWRHEMGTGDR